MQPPQGSRILLFLLFLLVLLFPSVFLLFWAGYQKTFSFFAFWGPVARSAQPALRPKPIQRNVEGEGEGGGEWDREGGLDPNKRRQYILWDRIWLEI